MPGIHKEELNLRGVTHLGPVLSDTEVTFFLRDLAEQKRLDIERFGSDALLRNGDFETVRDLARLGGRYLELVASARINELVDSALNSKAIVHSYNAIITQSGAKSDMLGYRFHRDQPFFKDTRTSIIVMIPLVDYSVENGATEFVPGTHLFRKMPSDDYMERHVVSARGRAGEAFVIDATLWHRAGKNQSGSERPMIVLKYTLAPFKAQVDFCASAQAHLAQAPELVRRRLGWDSRVCLSYEEFREPGDRRKFKSGQYDMTNTGLHDEE